MRSSGFMRRHRVAIASNLATLMAVGAVAAYAFTADGYQSHRTELNDGGIWVTGNADGVFGRINKPVRQADGFWFTESNQELDVVQQGAAVVGVDETSSQLTAIDPTTVRATEGGEAQLPDSAHVLMAGGTLAVLDSAAGELRAVRFDPAVGRPAVGVVAAGSSPLAKVGKSAVMTVTASGTVVAVSADTDKIVEVRPHGDSTAGGFAKATARDVGFDVVAHTTLTAVGERVVLLNHDTGQLSVIGGGDAVLGNDAVLQQPGAQSDSVLVATDSELLEVDLDTGAVTALTQEQSGRAAQPVRLGACVFGAWSGSEGRVFTRCGDNENSANVGDDAGDLVFRVNRDEVLLNDRASGGVWDIDDVEPQRLDNWDALQARNNESNDDKNDDNKRDGDKQPPQAKPDDFGARPGRLTVLHPLDNDTAPAGRILAVRAVDNIAGPGEISIGPDRQTVQITLPADARGTTTFRYTIDDGRDDMVDQAIVTVVSRGPGNNEEPQLRDGFKARTWTVPASGTIDVPVLGDWRDPHDGDLVGLASAVAEGGEASGAVARTTASGRVRFTAPAKAGNVTVKYAVSDGFGKAVPADLTFQVQAPNATNAIAAVAEPDIASGEVGEPIVIRPLANDLPGSDPVSPAAVLELAGEVMAKGGLDVKTDVSDGTITVRAKAAKTFFLTYAVAYGTAKNATGQIRLDVVDPQGYQPPVAMPDQATVFGSAPTLVDVLANDIDPRGAVLVTSSATAETENQLDVAVVGGRWLRISPRQAAMQPKVQVVRYQVTNGLGKPVQGEVTVTQRDAVPDNTPVTSSDRVTVRSGQSAVIPVLDDDFSPAGDPLTMVTDLQGHQAGRLKVTGAERGADAGEAFVSGKLVRYVAPDVGEDPQVFEVEYVAANSEGLTAPGTVVVNVIPAKARNRVPQPPTLEGRVIAGSSTKIRLPGSGVDPDGDGVTLVGLASAPSKGYVEKIGANSIVYQAFPGQGGTDEFAYEVVDSEGESAQGVVRVAVVPVGEQQPPLAVDDEITSAPGRTVRADALANDLVGSGDYATVSLVDPVAEGVTLEGPLGPLTVEAPAKPGATKRVIYRLSNGVDTTQATVTVRTQKGFNNPPVVFDAFGSSEDADAVEVDVLKTAYDPDGSKADLSVSVFGADQATRPTVDGGLVTVKRGDHPQVVPFRVEDADGGVATASIFVPARGNNAPYLRSGALIKLDPGKRETVQLDDVIVDPAGGKVRLTRPSAATAAPSTLMVKNKGLTAVEVVAPEAAGRGVLLVQVRGKAKVEGDAATALLGVPVQYGETKPVVTCPRKPIEILAGQTIPLTVQARCQAWNPDPAGGPLAFEGTWDKRADGLSIAGQDGAVITVAAADDAKDGTTGTLAITAAGSKPGLVRFVVRTNDTAPPPSFAPIRVEDLAPGESQTIDLMGSFQPGVNDPEPTVLDARQRTDVDARISVDGTSVTITAGPKAQGRAEFLVTMSDVARADTKPRRQAQGSIVVNILGRPDAPGAPVASIGKTSQTAQVSWRVPAANGSPITSYEVEPSGRRAVPCESSPCSVDGLQNGKPYRFRVRAINAVGASEWSRYSNQVVPDALPGPVGRIVLVKPTNRAVKIAWSAPKDGSSVDGYMVSYLGRKVPATTTTALLTGLDNSKSFRAKVWAVNSIGSGPPRESPVLQSQGPVGLPEMPVVNAENGPGNQAVVRVTWAPVDPNGPGTVTYRLLHNDQPVPGCDGITVAACDVPGIVFNGADHSFQVGAAIAPDPPRYGPSRVWQAVGAPDPVDPTWTVEPTGKDLQATVSFSVPELRAASGRVEVLVNGKIERTIDAVATSGKELFSTPTNAGKVGVVLRVCNTLNLCSTSTEKAVQTFGPLNVAHILEATSEINGRDVRWHIRVDPNGDDAFVFVSSAHRPGTALAAPGPGPMTVVTDWVQLDYASTETLRVKLADESPNRGSVTREYVSARTVDPPPPSLAIGKGAACNDTPGSDVPGCRGFFDNCTDASCGFVRAEWSNFNGGRKLCFLEQFQGGEWLNTFKSDSIASQAGAGDLGMVVGTPGVVIRLNCGQGYAVSPPITW